MRGPIAALAVTALLLPPPAAAQFQENSVRVPTSPETRAAQQAETDAVAEPAEGAGIAGGTTRDWREAASPYDIERIEANEKAYGAALEIARKAGSEADRAELARILAELPQPIDPAALPGSWQCRTIRFVADPAELRIYGWYPCRITEMPQGLLLEKLGGSELSAGYLYPDSETRMIYLGYTHGPGEPARDYDGAGGATGDDPANRDDAGIVTQRGPDRLLLARPDPVGEPDYDLLELRRR